MLRPLPLITMRQQADETGHAQPFALARRDELVEHDLRTVGEVAELRLPQRQRVRLGGGIAVCEAEHGLFRQARIEHFESRLRFAEMIEWRVALLGVLVEQHRMPLRERTALTVLAGKPHRMAFLEQGTKGKRLSGCPIDSLPTLNRLGAIIEETLNRLVNGIALRNDSDFLADLAQHGGVDAGIATARIVSVAGGFHARPASVEPIGLVRLVAAPGFEFGFQPRAPVGPHLLDFTLSDDTLGDQLLAVNFLRGRMRANLLVHQRLRKRRLVALVVAEAPVAEHVNDD